MSQRKFKFYKKLPIIISLLFITFIVCGYFKCVDAKSLDYKIANMVIVGFDGTKLSKNTSIYDALKNKNLGGVLLYEKKPDGKIKNIKNKKQVAKLCKDIKKANKKALIAIDEEGGYVSRLNAYNGFAETSSARVIADRKSFKEMRVWSRTIADKLSKVNINFNLAPVVDLNINENSKALGQYERMFSKDFTKVSILASIFIREHRNKNILTSIKHFPGYGSAYLDPHKDFVDVSDTWSKEELMPYKILIKNNLVDTIMTAHIFNKNLDDEYVATLSKKIINGVLRKELGYNGVVVSDDLTMAAIKKNYSFEDAVILSLNAGVDMLLFSNEYYNGTPILDGVIVVVKDAIKKGTISKKQIDVSYNRIMALKDKL